MAPHSSVLAWKTPGTGEPSGLPSMGSHRVGHDWSDLAAAAATLQHIGSPTQKPLATHSPFSLLLISFTWTSPAAYNMTSQMLFSHSVNETFFFLQFPSKSDSYALHKIFYLPIHYSILSLCFSNRSSANSLLSNMETGSQEPKEMTVWNWHRQECKTDQGLIRETCSPPRFPTQYSQIVPETKEKHEINSWCGEIILTDINMY